MGLAQVFTINEEIEDFKMQVILLEKVQNVGELGDTVKVKPGYARNYLVPQGKAVPATPQHVAEFEEKRAELERQQAEVLAAAKTRAEALQGRTLSVVCKAGDEGRLFGSVGTQDIAEAAASAGLELSRNEIRLPKEFIRQVGEYEINVHLHTDVDATLMLDVVAEGSV